MADNIDLSRRELIKLAGTATGVSAAAANARQGAPAIQTVKAANDQVKFGIIGVGGRGSYLLKHLTKVDNGQCVAVCDKSMRGTSQKGASRRIHPYESEDL